MDQFCFPKERTGAELLLVSVLLLPELLLLLLLLLLVRLLLLLLLFPPSNDLEVEELLPEEVLPEGEPGVITRLMKFPTAVPLLVLLVPVLKVLTGLVPLEWVPPCCIFIFGLEDAAVSVELLGA